LCYHSSKQRVHGNSGQKPPFRVDIISPAERDGQALFGICANFPRHIPTPQNSFDPDDRSS